MEYERFSGELIMQIKVLKKYTSLKEEDFSSIRGWWKPMR
jgi:hypothetical protein